jgi:hypothetical protein
VRSTGEVAPGERLQVRVQDGTIVTEVIAVEGGQDGPSIDGPADAAQRRGDAAGSRSEVDELGDGAGSRGGRGEGLP